MTKQRRHFAGTEKVAILKRHLLDKVPISDLCDELDLCPNQFYAWLKEFFENGHAAFDNGRKSKAVEDVRSALLRHFGCWWNNSQCQKCRHGARSGFDASSTSFPVPWSMYATR